MSTIVVLALGLMVWPASVASGAQSLTVNGADVTSITLELGQSCTVEVVSDDSASYTDYVGFDNGVVLGNFSHLETKPEAGNLSTVADYNQPTFYGYYLSVAGFSPAPSPGVHFVFQYEAQELGTTNVKLYDGALTSVIDAVHITVILPKMGTAFSYQGRLMDDNEAADGIYDFEFKLYDYISGGSQLGSTIDINDLDVIDGHFAVDLDFGSGIFDGNAVWLETTVAQGDGNDPCTLKPRVELTPTPYALYAKTAHPGHSLDAADGSPTDSVYVDDNGNVGIGTTTPTQKLEVRNTEAIARLTSDGSVGSRLELHNINEDPDTLGFINFSHYFSGVRGQIAYSWDGMDFKTANMQRMRIHKNGNVGIGTSSPDYDLDISGLDGLRVTETHGAGSNFIFRKYGETTWDYGPNEFARIDAEGGPAGLLQLSFVGTPKVLLRSSGNSYFNGGNVGIGKTSPVYKLTVSTSEPTGRGVYGEATNSGNVTNYGGHFTTQGGKGRGVYGGAYRLGDVKNYGGYFTAAGDWGSGVYGEASSVLGNGCNYGGHFKSKGKYGCGVYGEATGTHGIGVKGTGTMVDFHACGGGRIVLSAYLLFAGRLTFGPSIIRSTRFFSCEAFILIGTPITADIMMWV